MLNGRWRDQQIGSGTHVWKFDAMVRAGELSLQDFMDAGTPPRQTHTRHAHDNPLTEILPPVDS
jgi:dihydroxy-acid dehydratase